LRHDSSRLPLSAILAVLLSACDPGEPAPPDAGAAPPDVRGEVSGPPVSGVPWTVIRVIDDRSPIEDLTPGADLDLISLDDSSGNTLALGCVAAALRPSPVPFPAADPSHNDPARGTLGAIDGDETAGTGFVSLGGATLWCDTGVEIRANHHVVLFEVHRTSGRAATKNDSFSVDLCQTMDGPCLTAPLVEDIVITGPADDYVDITVYADVIE